MGTIQSCQRYTNKHNERIERQIILDAFLKRFERIVYGTMRAFSAKLLSY